MGHCLILLCISVLCVRLTSASNTGVLFHYFLYITNALLLSFILSTDRLSRVIKRDEPKGSPTLAYFIPDPLIVHPYCAHSLKDFILYYSPLVVQRSHHVLYLKASYRVSITALCILFTSTCVLSPQELPLLRFLSSTSLSRRRGRLARHLHHTFIALGPSSSATHSPSSRNSPSLQIPEPRDGYFG